MRTAPVVDLYHQGRGEQDCGPRGMRDEESKRYVISVLEWGFRHRTVGKETEGNHS